MPYLLKLTGPRMTLLKRGAPQMHLCKFDYSQYRTSPRDLSERVVIITKQISQDFLILDPVTKSSHTWTYTISELIASPEMKLSGVKKNRENIIAKSIKQKHMSSRNMGKSNWTWIIYIDPHIKWTTARHRKM